MDQGQIDTPPPSPPEAVHYRTAEGAYIGAFAGATPPPGAIECPAPPHGSALWVSGGWQWDEAAAVRAEMTLTFSQLLIGLVAEGWITEQEGIAWLSGALPAPVEALIATLPAPARFPARARAVRPSVVMRADPLVVALGMAQQKTPSELDAFFSTYRNA